MQVQIFYANLAGRWDGDVYTYHIGEDWKIAIGQLNKLYKLLTNSTTVELIVRNVFLQALNVFVFVKKYKFLHATLSKFVSYEFGWAKYLDPNILTENDSKYPIWTWSKF